MADFSTRIQEVSIKLSNIAIPTGLMASVGIPLYNSIVELNKIVDEMREREVAANNPTEQ